MSNMPKLKKNYSAIQTATKEGATKYNGSITKEQWKDAVTKSLWAIAHKNTTIVFDYPDTQDLFKYVDSVPNDKFAEFLTLYGAYLKDFIIRHHGESKMLSKPVAKYTIRVDKGAFFPDAYDTKTGFSFITSIMEVFNMLKSANLQVSTVSGMTFAEF